MTAVLGAPVADVEDSTVGDSGARCGAATRSSATPQDASSPTPRGAWLVAISAVVIATSGWAGARLANPSVTPQDMPPPPGIEGFAEMYVATILSGGPTREHDLAAYVIEPSPSPARGPGRKVAQVGAIRVRPIGPEYFVVTVAAEVDSPALASNEQTVTEFYEVAVAAGDGFIATAPPLPISAPVANAAYGIHSDLLTPADATTTSLMRDFLEAYLMNGRRLPRFVTPESGITAVTTFPVTAVEVTEVTVDSTANLTWATAAAVATTADGMELAITVSTRLVAEHGGLRVAELLPGPPPIAGTAE